MRVTSSMMVANSLDRLSTRLERYEHVQSQLASGKRFTRASEDPGAAAQAMGLRTQLRSSEQLLRNAADAESWLDRTDGELQGMLSPLQRVRDLAVAGATDRSQPELDSAAQEVRAIREQLVSIANSRHQGRPVFGGFGDSDPVTFDAALGWQVRDQGDMGESKRRVSDAERVTINITADEVFGFDAANPGNDVFTVLDELADSLEAGDTGAVSDAIARVDTSLDKITGALGSVGAATNRVTGARHRVEGTQLTLRTQLSEVVDVDVAEAIVALQVEEVAYQATLGAIARALPPTLAAFLR